MTSWELLEPRRLLAYDLAITSVSNISPFTRPGGELHIDITYDNLGPDDFVGTTEFSFTLTTDQQLGNADDVSAGSGSGPDIVDAEWEPRLDDSHFPEIPDDAPPGVYYLVINMFDESDDFEMFDPNVANNAFATESPVIVITDAVWPSDTVLGTDGNDRIFMSGPGLDLFVSVNGDVRRLPRVAQSLIDSGAGDDRISVTDTEFEWDMLITGSGGKDRVTTGRGDDSISGGNGHDRILSGDGNDDVLGGAGWDYINTEAGSDLARGAGGNDKLIDLAGNDYLIGGAGNDVFDARDSLMGVTTGDSISGNGGNDTAFLDEEDGRSSIEAVLE